MKKKLLGVLLVLFILLFIGGCGKKDKEENNKQEENKQTENANSTEKSNNNYEDIELYSDNTKIVFKTGAGKAVYYYSGNEITGFHAYFDYKDKVTAEYALSVLNVEEDETIDKAYVQGKYVVVEYAKSEYENLTVEEVRTAYSYLEELKKQ